MRVPVNRVSFLRADCVSDGLVNDRGTQRISQPPLLSRTYFFYDSGRYVLHEQAQKCAKRYRILGAVNTAIETNGIKVMILLRLSPLVPFSGFNLM